MNDWVSTAALHAYDERAVVYRLIRMVAQNRLIVEQAVIRSAMHKASVERTVEASITRLPDDRVALPTDDVLL